MSTNFSTTSAARPAAVEISAGLSVAGWRATVHSDSRGARMITIRRDSEIFDTGCGLFRARWHFSFDRYRDPEHVAFGAMRVFNDDRLVPGAVWPLHPHRDVEGLTYVV